MNRLTVCSATALAAGLVALAVLPATAQDAAAPASPPPAATPEAAEEKPYKITDGKVDPGTYNGYRRYHASCHVCHGPDGLGSSYAPNLTESLKRLDYAAFTEVIINGRQNISGSQQSVMPAFGEVQDVATYIDDLYAYLKARSDGVVARGRPPR
jgi:methanol metabolism-related c-type cytochrome